MHYGIRIVQRREWGLLGWGETQKLKKQVHMVTNKSRCNKNQLDKEAIFFCKLEIIKYKSKKKDMLFLCSFPGYVFIIAFNALFYFICIYFKQLTC